MRGVFGHLFRVMEERAGERFDQPVGDHRVGRFFRKVSTGACDKVAGCARAADRLRQRGEGNGSGAPAGPPTAVATATGGGADVAPG